MCVTRNLDQQESERLAFENAKDIIACGFDRDLTFIFSDYAYMAETSIAMSLAFRGVCPFLNCLSACISIYNILSYTPTG